MNHLQALAPLAFLLLFAASTANASILEDTCKSLSDRPDGYIYQDCLEFFEEDKGSATADNRGLAVIAAKNTARLANKYGEIIADLKSYETDKKMLRSLSICAKVYSDVVGQAGRAAKGIASGKAEGLQDAMKALNMIRDGYNTCEKAFKDIEEESPLVAEDMDLKEGADLALAVIELFKSSQRRLESFV